ncbi:MAG: hypothetical protein MZV63_08205 [Marinilabiliales bacterium]|nr:hypothetical protein [Marinilabiliales bacterium]
MSGLTTARSYGFTLASPADTAVEVTIAADQGFWQIWNFDLSVPPVLTPYPGIDEELVKKNNLTIRRGGQHQDMSYISSWMKDIDSRCDRRPGWHTCGADQRRILKTSMGNYSSIAHLSVRVRQ